jgi:23S rRNA (guanosine2251-2'-O)-methyltransferase
MKHKPFGKKPAKKGTFARAKKSTRPAPSGPRKPAPPVAGDTGADAGSKPPHKPYVPRPQTVRIPGPRDAELIYGVNPIREAMRSGKRKFYGIVVKEGASSKALREILDIAVKKRIEVITVDPALVSQIAEADGTQGILASVSALPHVRFDTLLERASIATTAGKRFVLAILDGVQDPQNLGAIIRSAEAFKIDAVLYPQRRSASYTASAAKASAGAGEHVPLCVIGNVSETLRTLGDAGFYRIAMEEDGNADFSAPSDQPLVIVLGGEGTGARPLTLKRCDAVAKIQLHGAVNSLNVSAAAAIAFYLAVNK